MRPRIRRYTLLVGALGLLLTAFAASGSAGAPAVRFLAVGRAYQGKPFSVSIAAKTGSLCSLAVRYRDGASQSDLRPTPATGGRATWKWTLPQVAAPGAARLTAQCGLAKARHTLIVVGTLIPPKIAVVKSGFSIRPRSAAGSSSSYGVVLRNKSPNVNAIQVSVQVNFVLADGRLIGTATQTVPLINAGSLYNLAGTLAFPGAAPVVKLEFVILVGTRQKAQRVPQPAVDNVRAVPQQYDPTWTAWVQGEVINTQPALTLKNAQMSAVLFDAAGNVLGGAMGSAFAVLPPGTREIFKLTGGVDSIPFAKVASVAISIIPTWEQPVP